MFVYYDLVKIKKAILFHSESTISCVMLLMFCYIMFYDVIMIRFVCTFNCSNCFKLTWTLIKFKHSITQYWILFIIDSTTFRWLCQKPKVSVQIVKTRDGYWSYVAGVQDYLSLRPVTCVSIVRDDEALHTSSNVGDVLWINYLRIWCVWTQTSADTYFSIVIQSKQFHILFLN